SVANQRGNTRVLCESFGGAGWDISHKELKRLTDWQMVLGVNYINQHMARWTLRGARKNDYPPSFSYHNTNWNTYKTIGDYTARLSLALSSGKQINDILIIEPTTTAWTIFLPIDKYDHPPHWDVLRDFGNTFQQFVTKMEKSQIEYDLGSEYIMREWGAVEGNKLVVGERSYSKVVLPPGINNLNSETLNLLKEYLSQGGVVYSFNDGLGLIDGVKSDDINILSNQYPSQWNIIDPLKIDTSIFNDKDLVFEELPNTGKFYHHRRVLENGELLFLVNSDMDESATGKIKVKSQKCYELNLNSGETYEYPTTVEGDSMYIDFSLNTAGSLLLYLGDEEFIAEVKEDLSGAKTEVPTTELKIKRNNLNVLYIDYMDLKVGDKRLTDVYYYNAMDSLYNSFGFEEGNPWCRSVQYKTNTLDREILLGDNDGFELTYKFKVSDQMKLTDNPVKKLVIEAPELFNVYVNGNLVNRITNEWYIDKSFGVYSLEGVVVNGENIIDLKASKMDIHAEIQPVYVLGDFNVDAIDKGWKLSNEKNLLLGTWDEQGAPFYPNCVEYKKQFSIETLKSKYTVECLSWSGAQAIVKVNNKTTGILGWDGDELNITDFVTIGENNIAIEVYGTLKNTVGPFHDFVEGFAGPLHWKDAPTKAPNGKQYKFAKYGLTNNFKINQIIPLD
ncbi:MAG: hypothetical protein KAH25_05795, partial [Bacteroidales bacterium]|nr:hypothetical protein [Bacteroidales bacterium]